MLRKTKIVCTLGPSTDQEGVMRNMIVSGMNVARFNFPTAPTRNTPPGWPSCAHCATSCVCLWPPCWIPKALRSA